MHFAPALTDGSPVVSVSELNRRAKQLLERNFPLMWVSGEVSNFIAAASGHWYFSLKDGNAQVRCAMFRHKSQYLDWQPRNGDQIEVRALVTLYEPRGEYQLNVENIRRAGLGALYEAFGKLKARLEQEGLFDEACKKPLPAFPRQIGIVTSPAAAALRDVLTTLRRRMPSIPVILYPTPVQGEGSAAKIAEAIRTAASRAECDVLIVCRGGGNIEDLWAFNEEVVARAIHACPIPVVSGVGHETDFTISDFVADRRAPTPTSAAEQASPYRADLQHRIEAMHGRLNHHLRQKLEQRMQQVDYLSRRLVHPGERLNARLTHLTHLNQRLNNNAGHALAECEWHLQKLAHRLTAAKPDITAHEARQRDLARRLQLSLSHRMQEYQTGLQRLQANLVHLNPQSVLERGFSMVRSADGKIVYDSKEIALDEALSITFARGSAEVRVTRKEDGR
ncbi:exodeoxyribonuclease VII large subunit [Sulfuricella sp. T08]|uniref:exodeoxyribonuclease VII large subunit n=1 Tax=Sulfuricella sp. T08 TaxID=1632857 RepID=UPI0006179956|nr:exodeoxyribonuclease VII large subunit [Sulfuricella sp. T08]GAO35679.1 exodeoxyribonuclease VII large subunit [Sulfuricella sp. T08]